jgi:hypothetical protein
MALPLPLFSRSFSLHVHQDVGLDLLKPRLARQDLLHGAPALLELGLGEGGEPLGLGLEPLIDLGRRGDALVDVARLVAQVEDHAVLHGLVELVGVDVAPKISMLFFLSALRSGVPVKPMNTAPGRIAFMASCRSPDWVRWHSSTNTKRLPLALKPLGSAFFSSSTKLLMSPVPSPSSLPPNLWMSEQSSHGAVALSVAIRSAPDFVR